MSKAITAALAKALPELESAKKNAANPHLKSKYANLSAVMAAVEPVRAHGLWYRQVSHDKPDGACIETVYLHDSGEELSAGLTFVKADKQNPQGFGSAMTYARRYSLQCAFGLDAEDDDGHAASQPRQTKAPPPPQVINEEQRTELMLLLDKANLPVAGILAKARQNTGLPIPDLRDLPVTELDGIRTAALNRTQKEPANA